MDAMKLGQDDPKCMQLSLHFNLHISRIYTLYITTEDRYICLLYFVQHSFYDLIEEVERLCWTLY